jgi:hypothetical protein
MKTIVKDASGRTLGYKKTCGSQIIVEDASGKMLGAYNKNVNKTVDKSGKALYSGDQSSALFGL